MSDLDLLDDLDRRLDLAVVLPAVMALVRDVAAALEDGRLSLTEIIRLGRALVRVVQAARRTG